MLHTHSFLGVVNILYGTGLEEDRELADEIITLGMISSAVNGQEPTDIFSMKLGDVKNLILDHDVKERPYNGQWDTNVWGKHHVERNKSDR